MQNRGWSRLPAGLVLAGAALVAAVLAACGGPIASPSIGPSEIATVAPSTGGSLEPTPLPEPTPQPLPSGHPAQAQFVIGTQPCAVASDGTLVWITDLRRNKIVVIDPARNLVVGSLATTSSPCAIAHLGGALFVSEGSVKFLYKRDAFTGEELAEPLLGAGRIWDVDVGADSIWFSERDNGRAVRVDPATNTAVARLEVGAPASGIAVTDTAVWVAAEGADALVRIDPSTNAEVARVATGDGPIWVAADARAAFVTHTDGSLARVDAGSNQLAWSVTLGGLPGEPALAAGSLWVPNHDGGTLSRIDPEDGTVQAVLDIHPGLAVTHEALGDLWVLGYTDGLAWRVSPS